MMREYLIEFVVFWRYLIRYARYVRGIFAGLLLLIFLGAFVLSYVENISMGEAIYFAFITGLTIGYGDIAPTTTSGRVVSVAIGFTGFVFTGLYVAVATRALADTLHHFNDTNQLSSKKVDRQDS